MTEWHIFYLVLLEAVNFVVYGVALTVVLYNYGNTFKATTGNPMIILLIVYFVSIGSVGFIYFSVLRDIDESVDQIRADGFRQI